MTRPSQICYESRARYAISAVFFVFGALVGSWLPHIPDVQSRLGLSYPMIGNALLCSGTGAVLSMPLLGSLISRFGSKEVAFFGGLGACALVPFLLLQTTLTGLCINLSFLGVCYGCMDVGMNSHSVQVQALHERPILSAVHGWFSLGGIVGGISAAIATRVDVPPFFHLVFMAVLLMGLMIASRGWLLASDVDKGAEGPRFVLPRGILLVLGLLCVCAFVSEGGILDWSALYVRDSLHSRAEFAGIVMGLCSGAMALSRFVGDLLLHRFGDRNVVVVSGVLMMVGILAAVATPSVVLSMIGFSVSCFGIANMVPVFFKEAGNLPGVPTGAGMAAVTTCGYGGFLLGPPIIGMVAHRVSLGAAMGSLSLLGLIVTLSAPFTLRHGGRR